MLAFRIRLSIVGNTLLGNHLTRQRRLVHLEVNGLKQTAVGRHFVTRLHDDDVAHHHLAPRNLMHTALAHHLHRLLLVHLREHIELLSGIALKIKPYGSGEENGYDDAYCLHEIVLHKSQNERNSGGNKQDADDRILIFLEI